MESSSHLTKHSEAVTNWLLEMRSTRFPHKPCLLLTILEMAEAGLLENNRVTYNPWLIESFSRYFEIVKSANQYDRPYQPFVHISCDGIWTLNAQPGYEEEVRRKRRFGSTSKEWVQKHVSHVSLDSEFAARIKVAEYRDGLRREIVDSFFPSHRVTLYALIRSRSKELEFERTIREARTIEETFQVPVRKRDATFRRTVLATYNFTCAATGWRAVIGNVQLLDAAHLIPLSESNDNRLINGIVLTPTFHRAMDAHLIAPGPDDRWHIARFVRNPELPEYEPLRRLSNRAINYGGSMRRPDPSSLKEQVARLAKTPP